MTITKDSKTAPFWGGVLMLRNRCDIKIIFLTLATVDVHEASLLPFFFLPIFDRSIQVIIAVKASA